MIPKGNYQVSSRRYQLRSEPGETRRAPIPAEVRDAVSDLKEKLTAGHNSELSTDEITVPPGTSIMRWHIDTAYAPFPEGGRPHCTFQAKDTLDNTYELDIPARPPKTYRSWKSRDYSVRPGGRLPGLNGRRSGGTGRTPGTCPRTAEPASRRELSCRHRMHGTPGAPAGRRTQTRPMLRLGLEHAAKSARPVFFRPRLSIVVARPVSSATNLAGAIFGVLAASWRRWRWGDGMIRSEARGPSGGASSGGNWRGLIPSSQDLSGDMS